MLASLIDVLTYGIANLYFWTVMVNFIHPISKRVAVLVFLVSATATILLGMFRPLQFLRSRRQNNGTSNVLLFGFFAACLILGSYHPTRDTDAHVYHLPLALLMNASRWYPGIVRLSTHFGFPNGNSV